MIEEPIHIVVIDDGINEKFYNYNIGPLKYNLEITPELQVIERSSYDPYQHSHGTTCAGIIKKYAANVVLSSIKILNKRGSGVREQLVKAIEWCIYNRAQLVNLSLGSVDYRDFKAIKDTVNLGYEKGLIIVAACNNKDVITYPASLSNVIGVRCDKSTRLKEEEYIYNHPYLENIEITACSTHTLTMYTGEVMTSLLCNSFAAPFVTAMVGRIMEAARCLSLEDIKHRLKIDALNRKECMEKMESHRTIDWVQEGIVFNLSKYGIPFSKVDYCFNVIKEVNIKCSNVQEGLFVIWRLIIDDKDMANTADTVVIVINDCELKASTQEIEAFIESVNLLGKNIIFIDCNYDSDKPLKVEVENNNKKVWYPSLECRHFSESGKAIQQIDVPIIAIYDYTGKAFLSIADRLASLFKADGYHAVTVSDSCLGVLAGSEFIPYNPNEDIEYKCEISELRNICTLYEPDILILTTSMLNKSSGYKGLLGNKADIDINILISDEKSDMPGYKTGANDINEIIGVKYHISSGSFSSKSLDIFGCGEEFFISKLYSYIIDLFNSTSKSRSSLSD
ncbi:MAG: S8 family serine peptidase [Clostridia bacterium]|nr:S8 family serine peptidase [Clostridia bacterium]